MTKKSAWFILIASFGVLAFVISDTESTAEPDPTSGPRYACSYFIEQSLHNPDSFEPVNRLNWSTNFRDDGIITVGATYRATNLFGAVVSERNYCDIRLDGDDYRLIEIR